MHDTSFKNLVEKYDRVLPRYTSYPPANRWGAMDEGSYARALDNAPECEASIYVHIPFCEVKCAFCGCNSTAITSEEQVDRYVAALLGEIENVAGRIRKKIKIRDIHFGGGTPTSIGLEKLSIIVNRIRSAFSRAGECRFAIELDPRKIEEDDIFVLKNLGFSRISLGIQDLDPEVQGAIARRCDAARIEKLVTAARAAGISGVNFDLVYGLPKQTPVAWANTLKKAASLGPDRIAAFGFAYLPEMFFHQKIIAPEFVPGKMERLELFSAAVDEFIGAGYSFIGIDHFAKKGDELQRAAESGTISRNFHGYVDREYSLALGLGASAIGELGGIYAQNEKDIEAYVGAIEDSGFATARGEELTTEEEMRRFCIRKIMCGMPLNRGEFAERWNVGFEEKFSGITEAMIPLSHDGLVKDSGEEITVTQKGQFFLRSIAALFDPLAANPRV